MNKLGNPNAQNILNKYALNDAKKQQAKEPVMVSGPMYSRQSKPFIS